MKTIKSTELTIGKIYYIRFNSEHFFYIGPAKLEKYCPGSETIYCIFKLPANLVDKKNCCQTKFDSIGSESEKIKIRVGKYWVKIVNSLKLKTGCEMPEYGQLKG